MAIMHYMRSLIREGRTRGQIMVIAGQRYPQLTLAQLANYYRIANAVPTTPPRREKPPRRAF